LREDLESLGFGEFHIVLYIREPAEHFLSLCQQGIRGNTRLPFVKDPASWRCNFLRMTETWQQAFPDSLIVRKFPGAANGDVVEDFASLFRQYLGATPPVVSLRENTSLSAEGMQILQDYRETFSADKGGLLTPDAVRLVSFLIGQARDVPQTKPALKEDVAAQIRANHRAEAEELYLRYGVDLGLRDLDPVAPVPPRVPARVEDVLQSVDPRIVSQLLLRLASTGLRGSLTERSRGIAARVYRSVPPGRRPERFAEWLRSRL
jgi:hypothetical protein